MKNKVITTEVVFVLFLFVLILAWPNLGMCSNVYTIGDASYDISLAKEKAPVKLGPLPVGSVPSIFPESFLEADGSYGGGVVYKTIPGAKKGLKELLKKGILPAELNWHIYELNAVWETDVYELKQGDYRLSKPCSVRKRVQ
ncbi:DVU_2496 family lipoprotein [Halodesulfovibrio marinisediminis]|uniref:Uncharacterized protein n=1 Tax=Halodesulfovibrio marinisediminis DSM 17456 TaxID=1121457 RepID=A0A1N6FN57_9BACT|nr:DVU_2496 family lipoprotein [Halodesulfovibrio marinisediminis]SIN96701.1 hypothetical protein SAMN02745161_1406 [Halodesulfovibrio marinisediminis DSM 17456]